MLRRGRLQAIAASPQVQPVPVEADGLVAEIMACDGRYLGPCMLEAIDRFPAGEAQVVIPVSWHHWIFHRFEGTPDLSALVALRSVARTILDAADLPDDERLGGGVYVGRRNRGLMPLDRLIYRPPG